MHLLEVPPHVDELTYDNMFMVVNSNAEKLPWIRIGIIDDKTNQVLLDWIYFQKFWPNPIQSLDRWFSNIQLATPGIFKMLDNGLMEGIQLKNVLQISNDPKYPLSQLMDPDYRTRRDQNKKITQAKFEQTGSSKQPPIAIISQR